MAAQRRVWLWLGGLAVAVVAGVLVFRRRAPALPRAAGASFRFEYPDHADVIYDSRMSVVEILDDIEKRLFNTCPRKTGVVAQLTRTKDGVVMVRWKSWVGEPEGPHAPQRNWVRRDAKGAFGNEHSSASIQLRHCPA